MSHFDSIGTPINLGSRVRFRGKEFTISNFPDTKEAVSGFPIVEFEEPITHTSEIPTEVSIDLVTRGAS